ncbi:MAG TPA: hypothetical protein VF331_04850 [Polyangiales bacterium]
MSTRTTKTADKMSRAKAEYALTHGADPTSEVFTKHTNKHVKAKAAKLAAAKTAVAA